MNTPTNRPPRAWVVRYAHFIQKHAIAVVVACLVITGISVAFASKLSISTDLTAILPRGYPSVEDLHKALARIGGTASLTIAVESPDLKANEKFADAMVAELRKEMGPSIANIDYKVDALQHFYRSHAAVYLSVDDLNAIDDDLKAKITKKKIGASPIPYDLGLDDEPKKDAPKADDVDDISKRLDKAEEKFARFPDGYYAGEDGHLLAIFVRPNTSGADSGNARQFAAHIRAIGDKLDPKSFNPELKFSFTGAYVISLDEQDAIKRDLVSTAGLCIGLIALAVTIYFRRIRAIALLGMTLLCGCAWAFGLAQIAVGYLNLQTAFLGSIIAGTGINYGVIFLARYLEERRHGHDSIDSMIGAIDTTWLATLVAALTTAVSFGTLLIARISSFRHFAIIGGGGILFCWLLTYSLFPAILELSERISPTVKKEGGGAHWPKPLVAMPLRFPKAMVAFWMLGSAVAVVALVHFLPNALENDFRNMRNKPSNKRSGAQVMDERVAHIRQQSMTPGFVVTDSQEEAKKVCEVMNARVKNEGENAPIKNCTSVFSLLPEHAEDKLPIAKRILDRLDKLPDDAFSAKEKKRLDDLRAQLVLENVELKDLPEELTRSFRETSGEVGRFVAIYPVPARDLSIKKNLDVFTNAIRRIDLGDGRVVTSSGDLVVFADILSMIARDAPRTTVLALVGVIVFVFLALRGGRATAHVVGALVIGVLWMVGIAALAKVKINFFNFVAIPTTFGIAVDYTINVYARYRGITGMDKLSALRASLSETGGAVFLCSITTIIGYATLIIADNLALVSFGKLAILGELTCVFAALMFLPATLLLDKKA